MQYAALMIDIIDSRRLASEDREPLQVHVKDCIQVLNGIFEPSLEKEVIFSAGDEVQGLFRESTAALLYARLFRRLIFPIKVRVGIGVGGWETRIDSGTSNEQDGSSYHKARAAISSLSDSDNSSIRVNSGSKDDIFVNTYIDSSLLIERKQSTYQAQLLLLMEIMFPIFDSGAMKQDRYSNVIGLVRKWSRSSCYPASVKPDRNWDRLTDDSFTEDQAIFLSKHVSINNTSGRYSTAKRGISKKISEIWGTTRQNIESIMKAGNIEEIRNIDLVALYFMQKFLEG